MRCCRIEEPIIKAALGVGTISTIAGAIFLGVTKNFAASFGMAAGGFLLGAFYGALLKCCCYKSFHRSDSVVSLGSELALPSPAYRPTDLLRPQSPDDGSGYEPIV